MKVNRLIIDFIEETTGAAMHTKVWTRGLSRPKRALYLSSPIGLGHARRDVAIAKELKRAAPRPRDRLARPAPRHRRARSRGEHIHPASRWLANESAHIASESSEHDLHCFQALRRMDEILVANFMVFQEVVEEGLRPRRRRRGVGRRPLLAREPELKRGQHVWLTDFVGFLPMPDGGEHEAYLTTDYNAEMIEHIARFPWIRDRAIFVGNPDDIVPTASAPSCQPSATGPRSTSRSPATSPGSRRRPRRRSQRGAPSSVTATTSWCASSPWAAAASGKRSSTRSSPPTRWHDGSSRRCGWSPSLGRASTRRCSPPTRRLEVHGYVDRLYRHLCVCDLAVVQGGLSTTMELAAAKRPFLYFPLGHHFEQNFHVRHRLDQYGAGRCMDYATTDPDLLAAAIVDNIGQPVEYRDVENRRRCPGRSTHRRARLTSSCLPHCVTMASRMSSLAARLAGTTAATTPASPARPATTAR